VQADRTIPSRKVPAQVDRLAVVRFDVPVADVVELVDTLS
jgi:hypothetical protein